MRSAIQTKYYGPTNTQGGRVRAKAEGLKSMFTPWDHSVGVEANHSRAAQTLAEKLEWEFENYVGGWFGDTCYFVDKRA